jgi:hypothetical protein
VERAVERVPHREMACSATVQELLNSTLGDKLDQLRGTAKSGKVKQRGKKIKVPAGKSYSTVQSERDNEMEAEEDGLVEVPVDSEEEEEDEVRKGSEESEEEDDVENSRGKSKGKGKSKSIVDSEDEEELMKGKSKSKGKSKGKSKSKNMVDTGKGRRNIMSLQVDDDSDSDMELPDLDVEQTDPGAGGSWRGRPAAFDVGSFVVAVYDKMWYLAQVEGEEPEEECEGLTLLKYMERRGNNQFIWGQVSDKLKTLNSDILLKVEPPIPVSSRLWGLPKNVLKEVERLFRVLWSIIFSFSQIFGRFRVLVALTGR